MDKAVLSWQTVLSWPKGWASLWSPAPSPRASQKETWGGEDSAGFGLVPQARGEDLGSPCHPITCGQECILTPPLTSRARHTLSPLSSAPKAHSSLGNSSVYTPRPSSQLTFRPPPSASNASLDTALWLAPLSGQRFRASHHPWDCTWGVGSGLM